MMTGIVVYSEVEKEDYSKVQEQHWRKNGHTGVSWPSGLVHWTRVMVLSECGFESWPVAALVSLARHLTIIASSFRWDVKL